MHIESHPRYSADQHPHINCHVMSGVYWWIDVCSLSFCRHLQIAFIYNWG